MKSALRASRRVLLPRGFRFAGVAAGLKGGGALDLGLVEAPQEAATAAVFTSNRVVAAPLEVDREHLRAARGRVRGVVVNSGNANCATRTGRRACERVCQELAKRLGTSSSRVFPSSTGVIGVELPAERLVRAMPRLLRSRRESAAGVERFARAILTTDTRPKLAAARFRSAGGRATLLGVAKGAGMIHPQLATMLVYLFTDAAATPRQLRRLLRRVCARTFNRMSVDGDTSTNDTVLLLASGAAGLRLEPRAIRERFEWALEAVCQSLAEQIVADGEGVRHMVRLRIEGARREAEAERVARAIVRSPLVRTAWAGGDPNWGRVLAAAGNSGVPVDARLIDVYLGPQQVCRRGKACAFNERAAHRYLRRRVFDVRVSLGRGRAAVVFLACDLTAEYVRINAHYRT